MVPGPLTCFDELTAGARCVWAKTDPGGASHRLLPHLLDVAASARGILDREPDSSITIFASGLGLPPENSIDEQRNWLAYVVGLHDIGKASPGFQAKSDPGSQCNERNGLTLAGAALDRDRHDMVSADFLRRAWPGMGFPRPWSDPVSRAVAGHHGEIPSPQQVSQGSPLREHAAWGAARRELLDAYTVVLGPAGIPANLGPSMPALAWLAGLTSVSDWIGSNTSFFPFGERDPEMRRHYELAQRRASDALDAIGWRDGQLSGLDLSANDILSRLAGPKAVARPLQSAVDEALAMGTGPALVIVEAPMGEGKTEAAFLAHLRLQARNAHRGMYVALPTQATGNAMFTRAVEFLRAFGSTSGCDIQLVHAGAAINDDFAALRAVCDIDRSAAAGVAASEWFTKRKRPLLSPYGAGTIDQAILAAMRVPHHFVRLFGLGNKTIVLDEVHAYDAYTGGLIEGLLAFLRGLGCSVILMSATLPRERRRSLLGAWAAGSAVQPPEDITTYPRITVLDADGQRPRTFEAREQEPVALSGCGETLDAIADLAADRVRHGGCGAVVVNTVARAQALYRTLRARLPTDALVILFHARYPGDERKAREMQVLAALGKSGRRGEGRPESCLLIATQVAEQSLDIDVDWMVTDLAPVDLVLQRLGRLHRHDRPDRPTPFQRPALVVAGLAGSGPPDLKSTAWEFVYDEYVLLRSWAMLRRHDSIRLPKDIDVLVQAVYNPDPLAGLPPALVRRMAEARDRSQAKADDQAGRARRAIVDALRELNAAYPARDLGALGDDEALSAMTRDGDESVAAVPLFVTEQGWSTTPGGVALRPDLAPSDSDARRIYMRQVRLSHKAVVKALTHEPSPEGWQRHPLLRSLRPLLFTPDRWVRGATKVHLDPELGVVIERKVQDT